MCVVSTISGGRIDDHDDRSFKIESKRNQRTGKIPNKESSLRPQTLASSGVNTEIPKFGKAIARRNECRNRSSLPLVADRDREFFLPTESGVHLEQHLPLTNRYSGTTF